MSFFTAPVVQSRERIRYFDIGCFPSYPADPASKTARTRSPAKTTCRVAAYSEPVFIACQVPFCKTDDQTLRASGGCLGVRASAFRYGIVNTNRAATLTARCARFRCNVRNDMTIPPIRTIGATTAIHRAGNGASDDPVALTKAATISKAIEMPQGKHVSKRMRSAKPTANTGGRTQSSASPAMTSNSSGRKRRDGGTSR